jgi:predicted Fe-Mo cluster-binding NifX family protein
MKIAAVTSDGKTIHPHFGEALGFIVVTLEDNKIVAKDVRNLAEELVQEPTPHHNSNEGQPHQCRSGKLLELITDCNLVLSGGMCKGVFSKLQRAELSPFLTDVVNIDQAVQTYLEGRLENHPELIQAKD